MTAPKGNFLLCAKWRLKITYGIQVHTWKLSNDLLEKEQTAPDLLWIVYTVTKAEELFRHPGQVPPDQSIPMTEEIFDISNRTIQQQCRIFATISDFSDDFPILISNFSDGTELFRPFLMISITNIKFFRRNPSFPDHFCH